MAVTRNGYIARHLLKSAIGLTSTANDQVLDFTIAAASRAIDRYCKRTFFPHLATRTFQAQYSSRLLLPTDILSVTTLTTDDNADGAYETTWAAGDFYLTPLNATAASPPEPYYELRLTSTGRYTFPTGVPVGVHIAGKFGYFDTTRDIGNLGAAVADSTVTNIVLGSNNADIGVGDVLLVDTEWMLVSETSGSSRTVTRAINGSTGTTHANAATVYLATYPVIGEACLLQTSRLFKRNKEAPFGITGSAEMGTVLLPRLDPDVRMLLDDFINESRRVS